MFENDLKHSNTSLHDKLKQLYSLNRGAKLDLGFRPQYIELLEKFGNPHRKLPKTIHVAGTNGKGSTIAFMRAILEEAGYKVHCYTSPHLIEFNERITLAGNPIPDETLETLIDEALSHNGDNDISFFEITTAIAFKAFASHDADILLLETGLGGRLDCTNVIESPLATIITSIGLDHQEFLGDTYAKITTEKAGVMKKNAPCIIAQQTQKDVQKTLLNHAENNKITTLTANIDWHITQDQNRSPDTFHFQFRAESYRYKNPNIQGPHQLQNAATAIAALHSIANHTPVSNDAINNGLQKTNWPARLQNITPHVRITNADNHEIWLDGGHNADAASALVKQIKNWNAADPKPLHLIIGMMTHKDSNHFLDILTPTAQSIHMTHIEGETSGGENWGIILQNLIASNEPSRILICGSLYLAGEILQKLSIPA